MNRRAVEFVVKFAYIYISSSKEGCYAKYQAGIRLAELYRKTQAAVKLMANLVKGRKAGEEHGWESIESVEAALGLTQ